MKQLTPIRRELRALAKYQGGWVQIILFIVSLIISVVLAPKPQSPKPAALKDFDVPLAEEDRPVPWLFGRKRITGANVVWYGDLDVQKIKKSSTLGGSQTVGFKYFLSQHMSFALGPIDRYLKIEVGDKEAWTGNVTANSTVLINHPNLNGGDKVEGGVVGKVDFMFGRDDQAVNAYLDSVIAGPIPAFRGTSGLVFRGANSLGTSLSVGYGGKGKGGYIGTTPYAKPWAVTCERILQGWQGGTAWYPEKAAIGSDGDMNPAHIVYQCLTDTENGQGTPASMLDDANFRQFADDCHAEGMGLSLLWNQSTTIDQFIQSVMDHVAGILAFDVISGKYVVRLIRGDYNPAALQTFNKTNSKSFTNFQRRSWGETVNELTIAYTDPATGKATAIVVQDLGNIRSQQARIPDKVDRSGISDHDLIRVVAGRELASRSTPLARGDLVCDRVGFPYGPGDVIIIEWPEHDLAPTVFRIIDMRKGNLERRQIIATVVEDIYALPGIEYAEQQPDAGDPVVPTPPADTPDNGGVVNSVGDTAPPASGMVDGDRYLIGSPASGAWAGHEGQIAEWDGDNEEWIFSNVPPGTIIYDEETGGHVSVDNYGGVQTVPWTPAIPPLDAVIGSPELSTLELVVHDGSQYRRITADQVGGGGGGTPGDPSGAGSVVYADGTVPSGNTIANTTVESSFLSAYVLPLIQLGLGVVIRFEASGTYGTHSSAPTLQLRAKVGGTTVLDTPAFTTETSISNRGWRMEGTIMVTTAGISGEVEAQGRATFSTGDKTADVVHMENTAKISVDISSAKTFAITTQWGTANAANTITLRQLIINNESVDAVSSVEAVALLHFNATDGTTDMVDETRKQWTVAGDAQIDTSQSKFGASSLLLDGTGDWVDSMPDQDFVFNTGDFTIEAFVRFDSRSGNNFVFTFGGGWGVYTFSGQWAVFDGGASNVIGPVGSVSDDIWYHVALVRASGIMQLYIDGTSIGSVSNSTNFTDALIRLGAQPSGTGRLLGWIDEVRVHRSAIYTANFTAPSVAFSSPVVPTTEVALLHFDADLTDELAKTWTAFGTAAVDTGLSKFGAGSLDDPTAASYITTPAHADFDYGTENFTIEFWIYPEDLSGGVRGIYDQRTSLSQTRPAIYTNGSGDIRYFVAGSDRITSSAGAIVEDVWQHIALCRFNGVTKLFVDGVQVGSNYSDGNDYEESLVVLGQIGDQLGNIFGFIGHYDDLRITKGHAKYTKDFTPPQTAFRNP